MGIGEFGVFCFSCVAKIEANQKPMVRIMECDYGRDPRSNEQAVSNKSKNILSNGLPFDVQCVNSTNVSGKVFPAVSSVCIGFFVNLDSQRG